MTKRVELLHEGWGQFKITKRQTKDGEVLIFEARISDSKEKPEKVRGHTSKKRS
jgi:hypothetical protein